MIKQLIETYHFQKLFFNGENKLAAAEINKLNSFEKNKLYKITEQAYIHSLCLSSNEPVIPLYMQQFYKQWDYICVIADNLANK